MKNFSVYPNTVLEKASFLRKLQSSSKHYSPTPNYPFELAEFVNKQEPTIRGGVTVEETVATWRSYAIPWRWDVVRRISMLSSAFSRGTVASVECIWRFLWRIVCLDVDWPEKQLSRRVAFASSFVPAPLSRPFLPPTPSSHRKRYRTRSITTLSHRQGFNGYVLNIRPCRCPRKRRTIIDTWNRIWKLL